MAASHPSLGASEPKGSSVVDRASDTDRPPALPPSIPSATSDARLQAALSATSRADASLSTLMRAVRDLTSGVSNAREANVALVGELGGLADLLGAANERQLALKNRVAFLEHALEKAQSETASERAYILEQQDAFIVGMLEDHEHVLAELNRELEATRERLSQRPTATPVALEGSTEAVALGPVTTPPPPTDRNPPTDLGAELDAARNEVEKLLADRERTRETLLKLQAQRDEAQAAVVHLTRERDVARSEGAQNRIGDAMRQAIPVHTPSPTPAGRMASTLPPESPRAKPPSSSPHSAPVPSVKPTSRRRTDPGVSPPLGLENRSTRSTAPMPVGISRPRAPMLDLSPREQRSASPPPEELRAALHPPSTPLPPPPILTPAPVTPRGPEANLGDIPVPTAPAPQFKANKASTEPPISSSKKGKAEPSLRPAGSYSLTNSVAPERVNTSGVSRPPRR